jgi:hypothetical protein
MDGRRIYYFGLLFIVIILLVVSVVSAGFFDKLFGKKETEDPRLAPVDVGVEIGNAAPQVILAFNVTDFISDTGTVTPLENASVSINVSFILDDPNGAGDIDLASGTADFTGPGGISRSSTDIGGVCFAPASCLGCPNPARQRNFTCQINLNYYDPPGISQWIVNVSAADDSGLRKENRTTNFSYSELASFNFISDPPTINWSSLGILLTDFNQSADNNLSIENFGNLVFNVGTLNASQLNGTSDSIETIFPGNFSASSSFGTISKPECDYSGTHGNNLSLNGNVTIPGINLPVTTDSTIGIANISFCIYPSLSEASLTPQSFSTGIVGSRPWILRLGGVS